MQMERIRFLRSFLGFFMMVFVLSSCSDEMEEHYEAPSWSRGSAWTTLELMGDYNVFLECAELSGLEPILKGKGLSTVMAPNDAAFQAYFSAHNIGSPSELTQQELIELVGIHIFYYAYDKEDLINFRPLEGDGATDEQKAQLAGLYHKFRTRCSYPSTIEYDEEQLKDVTVYHLDAMVPVFSYRMFETKGIDAKSSYEYFYPNSTWNGDAGFQVANASVTEYEIPTDNGYIYTIDQVIEPMNSLYNEIKTREDFSTYMDFLQEKSYYMYNEQLTTDFGSASNQLYLHYFMGMPYFDIEWYLTDYREVATNMMYVENVFVPKNSAFDDFFTSYWDGTGYLDYADVKKRNPAALDALLNNTYLPSSPTFFPQDATKSENTSTYGDSFEFDYDNIAQKDRVMCVNGTLYAVDKITVPAMFEAVVGPAFKYPDYSYYVSAISRSGLYGILSTDEIQYTTLMPTNEQIEKYGWIMSSDFVLQELGDDGYADVSSANLANLVNVNTSTTMVDLTSGVAQVVPTNQPWNYWYINTDGDLTTSNSFKTMFYEPATVVRYYHLEEIKNGSGAWSNGKTYSYYSDIAANEEMLMPADDASLRYYLAITPDANRPHYRFADLMNKAGLTNKAATVGKDAIPFLANDRFVAFLPTNEVLDAAITEGKIPGVTAGATAEDYTVDSAELLAIYLKTYFVPLASNGISNYPYLNSGIDGTNYTTMNRLNFVDSETGEFNRVNIGITTAGSTIKVGITNIDKVSSMFKFTGNVVEVLSDYNYFPFAFNDGCVHYINNVL